MTRLSLVLAACALGASLPALAQTGQPQLGPGDSTYAVDEMQSHNPTPYVARGDQIAIACEPLNSATSLDVRVVMQLSPTLGDLDTGFQKVLATDETVESGAVHVRVPDVPELANQTVHVQVYVLGSGGHQSCDAGNIRVV